MKIDDELLSVIDDAVKEAVKSKKEQENPFDLTNKTPLDILYECGRHNLPPMHAIRLLRGNVSENCLQETAQAIDDPDSPEMQSYADGVAMGEAEMSASLRQSTFDSKKDAYKSMNAEERKRVINEAISRNFGIGE